MARKAVFHDAGAFDDGTSIPLIAATIFDAKGDIPGRKPVWYVWRGGKYMPLEPSAAKE